MRHAVIIMLISGTFSVLARAADPGEYRGQSIAQWQQQLTHPSASARAAAAQAFVKIGKVDEDAIDALIGLLSDRDERVRFYAAYALGKVESRRQECLAALIKTLRDKDEHVRYTAQWSLAQIAKQFGDAPISVDEGVTRLFVEAETRLLATGGLPGHLREIRAAIDRLDPPVPQPVVVKPVAEPVAVKPVAVKPVVAPPDGDDPEVVRFMRDVVSEDFYVQLKAIEALRELGPPHVKRLLASAETVAQLGPVAWHAGSAIASLGEPVIPVLITALQHPSDEVRDLAAMALRSLGPSGRTAVPDLLELIKNDRTPDAVRPRILQILRDIGPGVANVAEVLLPRLKDSHDDDSIYAIADTLEACGAEATQATPVLLDRMKDSDVSLYVRVRIASVLVGIDPNSETVTQAIVKEFQESEDVYTEIEFARALCHCGPGAAIIVPRLIQAIDETSYDQRVAIVEILGKLGASSAGEVIPCVVARLVDPTEAMPVRVAAAKALGRLGPTAVQRIVDELRYGDERIQLIAAQAIVEIGEAARPARAALQEILIDRYADNELRSLAAVALGQLGAEAAEATPAIREVLCDPASDSYLRAMCAVSLGQIDPSARALLETLLDDPQSEVQIASAYSLCKAHSGDAQGLAKLIHWLESDENRGSVVEALSDIGETSLAAVVEKMSDKSQSRDTRLACLEVIRALDDRAIPPLLDALNHPEIADEAGWALRDRGNALMPTLVAGMEDDASFTPQAQNIIKNVIEDMLSGLGGGDGDAGWEGGHALVKRREAVAMAMEMPPRASLTWEPEVTHMDSFEESAMPSPLSVENLHPPNPVEPLTTNAESSEASEVSVGYKTVEVFYGTNRKPLDERAAESAGWLRWIWLAALGWLLLVAWFVGLYRRGARTQATAGLALTTLIASFGLFLLCLPGVRSAIGTSGPKYGGQYSDQIEMGVCHITIPDTHKIGELESPTLIKLDIREDLQKHIVLRSVHRMNPDSFYSDLRKQLQRKGNNILVFIHGYNVSFEDAARRTAQMSSDLRFSGAPVFYSWPSQADWWKYRVDEKNVELSVDQLKTFLLDIAQRSEADTVNLVAHSMGNRALTDALKEMDAASTDRDQLFNQVILAAPDIDADIFKQRIAPSIVTKAKHVTLYASSKDLALIASRTFNSGDPRAGDAGENLVVVPGIETIDVSNGDSSLLGHSYYGDNASVLRDIEDLLRDEPANSRRFLEAMVLPDDLTYWVFTPERTAQRLDGRHETR